MLRRDAVIGLVCLGGSLLLLAVAQGVPTPPLVPIGPAFYPRILFAATAVLSAGLVVTALRAPRPAPAPPTHYRLVIATFAIFTTYLVLLPMLGYRLSTFLFVGGLQTALEPPRGARWGLVAGVALATALVTYYVFEAHLAVLLPRGRLTGF